MITTVQDIKCGTYKKHVSSVLETWPKGESSSGEGGTKARRMGLQMVTLVHGLGSPCFHHTMDTVDVQAIRHVTLSVMFSATVNVLVSHEKKILHKTRRMGTLKMNFYLGTFNFFSQQGLLLSNDFEAMSDLALLSQKDSMKDLKLSIAQCLLLNREVRKLMGGGLSHHVTSTCNATHVYRVSVPFLYFIISCVYVKCMTMQDRFYTTRFPVNTRIFVH